jgi:hypothetical protein
MRTWALAILIVSSVAASAAAGPASTPVARMAPAWAERVARQGPDRWFLVDPAMEHLRARVGFDPVHRRWSVALLDPRRGGFIVTIDDATGAIESQEFFDGERDAGTPAQALDAVRRDPAIANYIDKRKPITLVPRFEPDRGRWRVEVVHQSALLGVAWVHRGRVVASDGPWLGLRGHWLRDLAGRVLPHFARREMLYVYALLFLVAALALRRLIAWRAADLIALVLLVPADLAADELPALGFAALMALTTYLFARCLLVGMRNAECGMRNDAATPKTCKFLIIALIAVLALQTADAFQGGDTGGADDAGLFGGRQFFDTGLMPYGAMSPKYDTYGPFHYLLYGVVEQTLPVGVNWRDYDLDVLFPTPDRTAARVLVFAFHLLTVVALIGIGRKHGGSTAIGLALALAYVLLPQTAERTCQGSRILPGAFVAMAFWAWPNPWLSAGALAGAMAEWFFPAALLPLWFVSFRGRARLKFALTIVLLGAVFAALALRPPPGQSLADRWQTVREATLDRQEGSFESGGIYFPADGLWEVLHRAGPAFFWGRLRVFVMVVYLLFCLLLAFVPARKNARTLAALTAAVILGTQLWKNLHPGEYVGWYAPILLAALFIPWPSRRSDQS